MRPRDPMCENDDCYEEEDGWVHVGGCDATGAPLFTQEEVLERISSAPKGSFLATTLGPALLKERK